MASSNTPAVKPPGRAKNKRFVQPVVPVVPQISNRRKNHESGGHQPYVAADGFTQEARRGESRLGESRQASPPALPNLPNGVHTDEVQEASEMAATVDTGTLPATPSPASQNAAHPLSEPQITFSALLKQPALLSTSPPPPTANKTVTYPPSSRTSKANGLHFASNLPQLRSASLREHNIMFHAPLESSSPSRTTQRSLSDSSILVPLPELSQLQETTAAPELDGSSSHDREAQLRPEPKLQPSEPTSLAEHSQLPTPPNVPSPPALTQLDFVGEPVGQVPVRASARIGDPNHSYDRVVPGEDRSDMADQNGQSDGQMQPGDMINPVSDATETQAKAHDGHHELTTHHNQGYENGHQSNGDPRGSRASLDSFSPEYYWPLSSDADEQAVPTVSEQLNRLFITREWSDWSIEISSPGSHHDPISYLAHGILMARSPTLRHEMQRKIFSHRLERVIVLSPDWYIQPQGFEAVMRYLYTESLLTMQEARQISVTSVPEDGLSRRDYQLFIVLSYWMTGLILKLPLVVECAVQLFQETVDWDVLELTFQQALILESALNPSADLLTPQPSTPGSSQAATASGPSLQNIPPSPFSPSDHFVPTAYLGGTQHYRYPQINAMMSRAIKKVVYEFICARVDMSHLETDPSSTTTVLRSYLPDIHEYSTSSRYNFNPALASIRFGNMPPAENESTTPATRPWSVSRSTAQVTSAILVNLKFADLRDFCRVLKASMEPASDRPCQWVQKLVEERERRRRKVFSSRTVSDHQRLSQQQAWNVVGWEEYVDISDDPLPRWDVCQKWTGFTLPPRR